MNLLGGIIVVALALQGASPAAAPLQPTGKWQVAFDDDLCAMSRNYGDGPDALTLAFRPFPMNDRAEVAILIPRGRGPQREGAAQVAFSPGRTLPAKFTAFGAVQQVRVVHVYLDRSLLAELAGAETVTITADGDVRAFAVSKAPAALRVLDQCELSLLQEWGVDPALKTGELARLVGVPAQYFGSDQYPSEALKAGQEGRVVALLSVSAAGRVGTCRVVKSSKATVLDEVTCRIARLRLRFQPALDASGRAIPSHVLLPVRWALPR